jgi:dGTPase
LVEAADDICYTIIDFEDGINLGLIEEEVALEYLIKLVKENINSKKYAGLKRSSDRLAYLRSLAINTLVTEAVSIFIDNEEAILNGEFEVPLLDKSRFKAQIDDIIKISIEKVYRSNEVVDKEIAGYKILTTLMDTYTSSAEHFYYGTESQYDNLIMKDLSIEFENDDTIYDHLMRCCHFISRLTDGNALLIFRKINGVL